MKNAISCIIILIFPQIIHAQAKWTFKNNRYYYNVNSENNAKEINKTNSIKKKSCLKDNSQKEIVDYDRYGRVTNYKMSKDREIKVNYYKDDLKQSLSVYKNNKLVERDSFSWDDKKLLGCFYFNKRNKLIEKESYKYDSTFVTEYLDQKLKKGNLMITRKRITEYYPGYDIKRITTYNKKGKPVYYSVFDCNPVGENHKVKKDSVYNCVKYDVDSLGNKIKVTVINGRQFAEKDIEYFNKNDERIARKTFDLKSNRLEWVYYFKPEAPGFTKFISYQRNKEHYKVENVYDDKNHCTESSTYSFRKLKKKNVNAFNEKGMLTDEQFYNRRNKKKYEWTYLYEYY